MGMEPATLERHSSVLHDQADGAGTVWALDVYGIVTRAAAAWRRRASRPGDDRTSYLPAVDAALRSTRRQKLSRTSSHRRHRDDPAGRGRDLAGSAHRVVPQPLGYRVVYARAPGGAGAPRPRNGDALDL